MSRTIEFFVDEAGLLSMSRLLMFGAFLFSTIIMFKVPMNDGYFAYFSMYVGTFAGTFVAGKMIDTRSVQKKDG